MKRTIQTKNEDTYYRGKCLGDITPSTSKAFKIGKRGSFSITVTEGTQYRIERISKLFFNIHDTTVCSRDGYRGLVCIDAIEKMFGKVDCRKRYNITVKKVRI